MEHQSLLNDSQLKSKVKHVIDNSLIILEKKISVINNELASLRNEYIDEIIKCKYNNISKRYFQQ